MNQRIGLLTLPLHINYGGIIQAAALAQHLRGEGHEVVLLDKRRPASWLEHQTYRLLVNLPGQNVRDVRPQARAAAVHRPFVREWIGQVTPRLHSRAALGRAVERLDLETVIVGSDQVWRIDYLPPGGITEFFLDLGNRRRVRKIAYAASFGIGGWQNPEMTEQLRPLMADFDRISVREASGMAIVQNVLERAQCDHVLDPTLMVDPALYDRMAAPARARKERMLLRYTLDSSAARMAVAEAVAGVMGARPGAPVKVEEMTLESSWQQGLDLPHWLRAFREADFVVTDSFHGVAFSIIFQKNFVAIPNPGRGNDRFLSLLDMLGIQERLITLQDIDAARDLARQEIDYAAVNARLDALRRRSRAFLGDALA